MCGITGYLGGREEKDVIQRMARAIEHRGPDAERFFSDGACTFGFRRLAIIDLETGDQPMTFGAYTLVFNGEIYNYRELRSELERAGHSFATTSDTEVLLHAYAAYGKECLNKLDGMFAFALWNAEKRELFAARDQLGVKPLYWTMAGSTFVFGSEIKALLAHPQVKRTLNTSVLDSYFQYRYIVGKETFFDGIQSLPPAHCLTVREGEEPHIERYWSLPVTQKEDKGEAYYVKEVRARLEATVERMMNADVPVGSYLSGGLDSSIVVGLMAGKKARGDLHTFAVGFKNDAQNEFAEARAVSEMWGTAHHELALSAEEYFNGMQELIAFKDAPLSVPNELPLWKMSQELRKHVTVVLSGEGADELFGGYGRMFRAAYVHERDGIQQPFSEYILERYKYVPDAFLAQVLAPEVRGAIGARAYADTYFKDLFAQVSSMPREEQTLYMFQHAHLLGLLHRLDTPTMAASVEGRVPYVDKELVEFVHAIPFHYKVRWQEGGEARAKGRDAAAISETLDTSKYLLREACKDLVPPEVLTRKKVGFPVPLKAWLSGPFKAHARSILTDARTRDRKILNQEVLLSDALIENAPPIGIWMMLNLELFMREYFD
ncbi:asparagine synthase (glutamine-hydrolyzing) [Candidatus Kaiserbacteria bacterium RIFCSPHIGHO2_01_FULL_54_36b]|uniref:asparagine synthase (glutamine-hydrolyzing) n=1 Tax=Candidatus Kaiserbacteria bacterium RIFCSPHIGHO2_01_FULL_54_36b TaxID=1798483 RepID=A0A1F6CMJ0_9BACT|nr:MAG: asparagine synthase (glutamine-hydrolyzing) [Candidatus Kaiserbacteria bacterium RIFCSPHIGHO2_01_FULL_54_36b]